ncbi:MAG: hypothetical protein WCW67_05020 [Candidatus Margulisiibacteriota bacterium]
MIKNLIIPTIEVIAKVAPTPQIKSILETNLIQLGLTFLAFILTIIGFWIKETFFDKRPKEEATRRALKYEIFHNFYQMIDLGRVSEDIKTTLTSKHLLKRLIYVDPVFVAFDSMIRNALFSAVKKDEGRIFSIYNFMREYNLVYKRYIENLERTAPTAEEVIVKELDKIIALSRIQKEALLNQYLDKISFLSKKDWEEFNEEDAQVWNNK